MISCPICNKECKQLTAQHIFKHNLTISEFKVKYPLVSLRNEASAQTRLIKKETAIIIDDIRCLLCNTLLIGLERKRQKFCSHSCSAKYNNEKRGFKNKVSEHYNCKNCGAVLNNKKYCNQSCCQQFLGKEYIRTWKDGLQTGVVNNLGISRYIRKYLFEKYDNKCVACGWSKVNETSKRIPLQVHHIDGNFRNNKEENLTLLCPNCHSLTPTFGGLNKGNGRTERYK